MSRGCGPGDAAVGPFSRQTHSKAEVFTSGWFLLLCLMPTSGHPGLCCESCPHSLGVSPPLPRPWLLSPHNHFPLSTTGKIRVDCRKIWKRYKVLR